MRYAVQYTALWIRPCSSPIGKGTGHIGRIDIQQIDLINVIASVAKQPRVPRDALGCFATLAMTDEPGGSARWYGLVLYYRSTIVPGKRPYAHEALNVDRRQGGDRVRQDAERGDRVGAGAPHPVTQFAAATRDQSTVTGIPDVDFAVRMVNDVFTLATLGAGVRCVVKIS